MALQNPYNNYTNITVNTASKEKLTMMLYDGALKFANLAILAAEENNLPKLNESVKRAMDIIWELQLTLKRDHKVADDMYLLYDYTKERLVIGNTDMDMEALVESRDLLKDFRDTWREAMKLEKKL